MQVEEEGCQPEAEEAEWCGIGGTVLNCDDALATLDGLRVDDVVDGVSTGDEGADGEGFEASLLIVTIAA